MSFTFNLINLGVVIFFAITLALIDEREIESQIFYPIRIKEPNVGRRAKHKNSDNTLVYDINGLQKQFRLNLKAFDSFISPNFVVEYPNKVPFKDVISKNGTRTKAQPLLFDVSNKYKNCIFVGTAKNINGSKNSKSSSVIYPSVLNLCNGDLRGGIIGENYKYTIKPVPRNGTYKKGKISDTPHIITKDTMPPNRCNTPDIKVNSVPIKTNGNSSMDNQKYTVELTVFAERLNGHPTLADVMTVVAMTAHNFKHPTLGLNIEISFNRLIYVEKQFTMRDHGIALDEFKKYQKKYAEDHPDRTWDIAGLLSPYGPRGFGIAYFGTCDPNHAIFVSNYFGLGTSTVFSHELGHGLGAPHDPGNGAEAEYCYTHYSGDYKGLMGYGTKGVERFRWSKCSKDRMIATLKSNGQCLLEQRNTDTPLELPRYTCDQLCNSVAPDAKCAYDRATCLDIACYPDTSGSGRYSMPLDGMPCLNGLLTNKYNKYECYQGKCVRSDQLTNKKR